MGQLKMTEQKDFVFNLFIFWVGLYLGSLDWHLKSWDYRHKSPCLAKWLEGGVHVSQIHLICS